MTKYLKKEDAPDWDYHIWTPLLAEREDMFPFDPKAVTEVPIPADYFEDSVSDLESAVTVQEEVKAEQKPAKKPGPKGPRKVKRDSRGPAKVGKKAA